MNFCLFFFTLSDLLNQQQVSKEYLKPSPYISLSKSYSSQLLTLFSQFLNFSSIFFTISLNSKFPDIAITELLGFKRLKDEGKVVGLAGHGDYWDVYYQIFKKSLSVVDEIKTEIVDHHDEDDLAGGGVYRDVFKNFFEYMGSRIEWKMDTYRKRIAYAGQLVLEETTIEILNNLHKRYPHIKKLALAGGIFANVKLNKRINELTWVKEVYITPSMGDEGLPLGSGLLYNSSNNNQDVLFDGQPLRAKIVGQISQVKIDPARRGLLYQPGDPVRASKAMIAVTESENPPLRLLLGAAALKGARIKLDELKHDFDTWADVTEGADFPIA